MGPAGKLFFVFNTRSGRRDRAQARRDVESALRECGRSFEILEAGKGIDPAALAARAAEHALREDGAVVAAGGDGTLNAVAQAALAADVPFGAVPLGTFNFFAREFGLPLEPGEAARALASSVVRPVQVGLVNGRVFLVNASLGAYPRLLEDREAFKRRYGRTRWVAMLAALWTMLVRRQPRLTVRIAAGGEARTVRFSTLFVGNNRLQLERLGLAEAQALEAGRLAAIRVRPVNAWQLLDIFLYGVVGRLNQADAVEAFAFREMEVATLRPRRRPVTIKVATDGESVRLALPLVFSVAPRPLRLLVPAERAATERAAT